MTSLTLALATPSRARRVARAFWRHHADLWRHVARRWYVYAVLTLAAVAAARYVGINLTSSVPERVVWLEYGALPARGDLIAFRFEASTGPAAALNGMRWLKRVKGLPGDRITVVGREVYVNDVLIGTAIERTARGSVLHPIAAGAIPAGHYFIGGSSNESLDSRYGEVGLVRSEQVLARAHAVF
jgi:conjugal transfer pilin signal peptidase TrbI